jgi:hypothetical protein
MNTKTKKYIKLSVWIIGGIALMLFLSKFFYILWNEDKALLKYKNNVLQSDKTLKDLEYRKERIIKYRDCNFQKIIDLSNWDINEENCDDNFKSDILWFIIPQASADDTEKNIFDQKIEKFCKIYWEWHSEKLQNRCAKIGKAQMRFETWWICKNKDYNLNCFNFRNFKKKYHEEFWFEWLDKSWFAIFKDKTHSIKYFAFHFFKYQYRKSIKEIVVWGCYKNLQGKDVCFRGFTDATDKEAQNYINFITNF